MDYYKIGQRIKELRKAKGLPQEKLAEKVGISNTHMSHIETGNTKLSFPVLYKFSEVLDASLDYLAKGRETNKSRYNEQISEILESCTDKEAENMLITLKAMKTAYDVNNNS